MCSEKIGGILKCEHAFWNCRKLLDKPDSERRALVLLHRHCLNCLRPFNAANHECPRFQPFSCSKDKCKSHKHHSLLSCNKINLKFFRSSAILFGRLAITTVSMVLLAVKRSTSSSANDICIFFDNGSTSTFVQERIAKSFGFECVGSEWIRIRTLSQKIISYRSNIYIVALRGNDNQIYYVRAYSIKDDITTKIHQLDLDFLSSQFPDHTALISSLQRDWNRPVELLMGLDYYHLHPKLTHTSLNKEIDIVSGPLCTSLTGSMQCDAATARSQLVTRVLRLHVEHATDGTDFTHKSAVSNLHHDRDAKYGTILEHDATIHQLSQVLGKNHFCRNLIKVRVSEDGESSFSNHPLPGQMSPQLPRGMLKKYTTPNSAVIISESGPASTDIRPHTSLLTNIQKEG